MNSGTPEKTAQQINALCKGTLDDTLGVNFVYADEDRIDAEIRTQTIHTQPMGYIHGGLYAMLVESLCSIGPALTAMKSGKTVLGLDNHTSFHRASRPGLLRATAVAVHKGTKTHVWEAKIFDTEGRLIASGSVRTLIVDPV